MPDITGTVLAANGIPQPNASVILIGGGGVPQVALTGIDGSYVFVGLATGRYKLSAVFGHSVTEKFIDITQGQATNTVVDFTITFFSLERGWLTMLLDNRWVILKYLQYAFLGGIGYYFFKKLIGDNIPSIGLNDLDELEKTRGIITYLIAVTTISMAALLMLASIMIGGKDLKERFALGKEILTLLIGILGTIIGFYYGSTAKNSETLPKDTVTSPHLDKFDITQNGTDLKKISIKGTIQNGSSPYSFSTVTNQPALFEAYTPKTSSNGVLSDILILKELPKLNTPISVTVSGTDKGEMHFTNVQSYTIAKAP